MNIRYRISPHSDRLSSDLTPEDFDYRCFPGNVTLVLPDFTVDASWSWVPIGHFATSLLLAVSDLARGEQHAEVPFTENDAVICFDQVGPDIRVSASFTPGSGTVALLELRDSAVQFATSFMDEVIHEYPSLLDHAVITERLGLIAQVRELPVSRY